MTTSHYIHINQHKIHYLKAGSGSKLLLAFHGYRNDAFLFKDLAAHLKDSFTLISVDLPFHGKTVWVGEQPMTKDDLASLARALMATIAVHKLSLLGYSIGGRVCLCLVEALPELVEHCVLLASDGLVFHPFYYFVTQTSVGKWLFRSFLSSEKNLRFINRLEQYKMLDSHKHRFVMHYLKEQEDRKKLHQIWNVLSLLIPGNKLKSVINSYRIPVSIFMGRNDKVIPLTKAQKFVKGVDTAQLVVLNKGHRLLNEQTLRLITKALLVA